MENDYKKNNISQLYNNTPFFHLHAGGMTALNFKEIYNVWIWSWNIVEYTAHVFDLCIYWYMYTFTVISYITIAFNLLSQYLIGCCKIIYRAISVFIFFFLVWNRRLAVGMGVGVRSMSTGSFGWGAMMFQDPKPPMNLKETSQMTHPDASMKMYDINKIDDWNFIYCSRKKYNPNNPATFILSDFIHIYFHTVFSEKKLIPNTFLHNI